MYAGAPYTVIQRALRNHPTVSELVPTMLGEIEPIDTFVMTQPIGEFV